MSKINILSSDIYNKISAGEVVERPASIVKELVENSIDAGAENIEITVKNGGIDLINVVDDGCGIEKDDIDVAFLPHTTSKIALAEDLSEIKTLGFRGEALASIAAVSVVEMLTKTEGDETGSKVEVQAGRIKSKGEFSANTGTSVWVRDLFYNVPARRKFLKSAGRESAEITSVVGKLILANPELKFKYINNDKLIYQTNGSGAKEAIYTVYGEEAVKHCVKFDDFYKNLRAWGYVSDLNYFKPNSSYQTFVVNGRYVNSPQLSSALKNAYKDFMMTKNFPFAVIYIEIAPSEIDVNVHPNKLEVKFSDSNAVFLSVATPVKQILNNLSHDRARLLLERDEAQRKFKRDSDYELKHLDTHNPLIFVNQKYEPEEIDVNSLLVCTDSDADLSVQPNFGIEETQEFKPALEELVQKINGKNLSEHTETHGENSVYNQKHMLPFSKCYRKGVLFRSYLMLEDYENELLHLIDQHAAHERILFDKFTAEYETRKLEIQDLLTPYVRHVSTPEFQVLWELMPQMEMMGFYYEPFGNNTVKLTAIPLLFTSMSHKDFFDAVLENCGEGFDTKSLTKDILAQKACKAAIKAGESMSVFDVDYLLKMLDENIFLKCPHGRPLVATYKKSDFDKLFKRIV